MNFRKRSLSMSSLKVVEQHLWMINSPQIRLSYSRTPLLAWERKNSSSIQQNKVKMTSVTPACFLRIDRAPLWATVNWHSSTLRCGRMKRTDRGSWLASAPSTWLEWPSTTATTFAHRRSWRSRRSIKTLWCPTAWQEALQAAVIKLQERKAIIRSWTSLLNYPR